MTEQQYCQMIFYLRFCIAIGRWIFCSKVVYKEGLDACQYFFLAQAGQPDHVDYILLMLLTSPPNDTYLVC